MNLDELDVAALRLLRARVGEVLQEKIDARIVELEQGELLSMVAEPVKRRGVPNKTEQRWMNWHRYLHPDAAVVFEPVELHEVKGAHIREAAVVRFKVARDRFPWWTFRMLQWKQGQWRELYAVAQQGHCAGTSCAP